MTLCSALLVLLLAPQSGPGVDDQKVAAAMERGIAWLRKANSPGADLSKKKLPNILNCNDLLLLTFVHAGLPEDDPRVRELLASALAAPLDHTYPVAMRAMVLEELDRVRYQSHILRYAQFLLDNQLPSGQWGYGEPSVTADALTVENVSGAPVRPPELGKDGLRVKPKVVRKLSVKQTRTPAGVGDFSNTQYAALGLRAASDAGIAVPKDVLARAIQSIVAAQQAGPPPASGDGGKLPSGRKARGWCYDNPCYCGPTHRPYGSMTAGMVGTLAIFDSLLGREWKRDTAVLDGLAWLQVHYTVETVPGPIEWEGISKDTYRSYYLYALERANLLTGNEKLGTHLWYADGVRKLLETQKPDGSWMDDDWTTPTWDTCFALLFLKRATRPLVPSTDRVIGQGDDH
jgi:hypothetical protein